MFQLAEPRSETSHRLQVALHPVLTIVGRLWKAAAVEGKPPRLEDISLTDIRKTCVTMARKHPDKPPVFFETNLSRLAYSLPRTDHWWLPSFDAVEHSDLSNKRKVSTDTTHIDPPSRRAPSRGTKRSAASVTQSEERADKDNDGKRKTTLQKAGKAVTHRVVHVVIQTHPNSPARKRRRAEKDAESKESAESEEETLVETWVGRGKVSPIIFLLQRY